MKDDEWNDSVLTVLKCEPLMEFQKEDDPSPPKQQVHKKLGPLWVVTVSYEHEMDYEPENCEVRIGSQSDPGISPGPIRFGGLAFRTWNMNGKKGLSVSAESWTQDARPSSKPRKADPPPVAGGGDAKAA